MLGSDGLGHQLELQADYCESLHGQIVNSGMPTIYRIS